MTVLTRSTFIPTELKAYTLANFEMRFAHESVDVHRFCTRCVKHSTNLVSGSSLELV